MIYLTQDKDSYNISFKYDVDILEIVRSIPQRKWHPESKFWSIPNAHLGLLLKRLESKGYKDQTVIKTTEELYKNAKLPKTTDIPKVDLSNIDFYVESGKSIFKHQKEFMQYAIDRQNKGNMNGFIVCDDQGLGKTLEAMNLAINNKKLYGFKHCLIICCINSSKYNWYEDIVKHTNREYIPYIIGSRLKRNGELRIGGNAEKLQDLVTLKQYGDNKSEPLPYFLILNIEAMRYKIKRKYPIREQLENLILNNKLNMIVIDEIHKNLGATSTQGSQVDKLKQNTQTKCMWLPMSGTPISNSPITLYLPLKLIDAHYTNSFYRWKQRYCIFGNFNEVVGYKNLEELHTLLQTNMLRRLKTEVLDLPPKIQYTEYVEFTPYQNRLYKQISSELINNIEMVKINPNPLSMFLRLRQVSGTPELIDTELNIKTKGYVAKNAKLARLIELVTEIIERGEKVVIFSNWVSSLRTIYIHLNSISKICAYTGTMKESERLRHKELFITDPNYKIMLCTIAAGGVSLTLTSANNLIFYDEPWVPADKVQAEDRIYRIGTTKSVNIYTLITKGSVDERVHNLLYEKQSMSDYLVDGKLDKANPNLLKYLLK